MPTFGVASRWWREGLCLLLWEKEVVACECAERERGLVRGGLIAQRAKDGVGEQVGFFFSLFLSLLFLLSLGLVAVVDRALFLV